MHNKLDKSVMFNQTVTFILELFGIFEELWF